MPSDPAIVSGPSTGGELRGSSALSDDTRGSWLGARSFAGGRASRQNIRTHGFRLMHRTAFEFIPWAHRFRNFGRARLSRLITGKSGGFKRSPKHNDRQSGTDDESYGENREKNQR